MKGQRNKKMKSEAAAAEKIDYISELPDSILCRILCFLDTRSAATTSLLSRRWNLVWTFRETLDFKYNPPTAHDFECCYPFNPLLPSTGSTPKFTTWVTSVLSKRVNSNLTKFHLTVKRNVDPNFVQDCISYAASHSVQQLKVRVFCKPMPAQLPSSLFTCQPLHSLKLSNVVDNSIALPPSFTFPNLKVLKLSNFVFSEQNYNKDIFMGCINLETLVLHKCQLRPKFELKVFDISCLKLKNLEISYWRSPCRHGIQGSIHVNAPQLVSFTFKGLITMVEFVRDLPRLKSVCIDLCYARSCINFNIVDENRRTAEVLMNMLGKFCTMKFLSLSMDTIKILSAIHDLRECGTFAFPNLQHLKFTVEDKCGEMVAPVFVTKCLLECSACGNLMLDIFKEQKLSALSGVEYSITEGKRPKSSLTSSSRHVISYLLEISPAAESLVVELAEASPEEE